jgi:hypothetical protein
MRMQLGRDRTTLQFNFGTKNELLDLPEKAFTLAHLPPNDRSETVLARCSVDDLHPQSRELGPDSQM